MKAALLLITVTVAAMIPVAVSVVNFFSHVSKVMMGF